ncbi:MAG TPA: hypothetical protein VEW48_12615 [Thermoanaerobaculia bacterium]|nr:hypothetical protein [Thermoanaerobaculia bacterium]
MKKNLVRFGLTLFAVALLMIVSAGSAAAETQTFRDQTNFTIFVPCANGGLGEDVDGILKVHAVFGITDDGAGGSHLHLNFKLQGVGIGSVTGDSYQLHADFPEFEIFPERANDNAGGSSNIGINIGVDAIGMGDAPNFHATFRFQGTMNANGVITMEKGLITETCN